MVDTDGSGTESLSVSCRASPVRSAIAVVGPGASDEATIVHLPHGLVSQATR